MSDAQEIIKGCQQGNALCQRELYEQYSPRFYALCCRYTGNESLAQEALADGFITIFQTINNYRGNGHFEAWMRSIFVHKAISLYRSERVYQYQLDDQSAPPEQFYLEDWDNQIDVKSAIKKCLHLLKPAEQIVFNLIAVEEYTFLEAAQELQEPETTVKSRYYRAKEKMQRMMSRQLGDKSNRQ